MFVEVMYPYSLGLLLMMGQSCDNPHASEATMKNMDECITLVHQKSYNQIKPSKQSSMYAHCMGHTVLYTILSMMLLPIWLRKRCPDSNVHGTSMRPIWGREDPGGPHVGPMNFAIWVNLVLWDVLPQATMWFSIHAVQFVLSVYNINPSNYAYNLRFVVF